MIDNLTEAIAHNLYADSEPCCNCTDDNDMFEPIESEAENE